MTLWQLVCLLLSIVCTVWAAKNEQQPLTPSGKQPNIVLILTDDQDLHMDSLSYMPHLKKHITDQGTSFHRHYCTVALCCPSRVSLWTGKAAHNTNVTDVNPPHGGYPKFISQGFNDNYFPLWMQEAGYSTYYVGKLFNAQTVDNYNHPHAAGWTGSDFLLDPYTYEYLNATFQRNHDEPVSYEGQYSTDVLAKKAYGFLDDGLKGENPFFLTIAPTAPHSNVHFNFRPIAGNYTEKTATQSPPVPAKRHEHLFEDVRVPRTPHFNPSSPNGVSWISRLPQQNETNVGFNDHFYRSRLQSLQAVDEIVDELVRKLEEAGVLDETYIFFSTDNGYHIGQHRLQPGKQCAYEEDINIPFIVRGPGVPKGQTTDLVTSHTDLAPTFLQLAGAETRSDFDGEAIPLTSAGIEEDKGARGEHVNVEMWGIIMSEGKYGSVLHPNHTYKALRVVGEDYNLLYTVWCSGEHELYDLTRDPYEMINLYTSDRHASLPFLPTGPTTNSESTASSTQDPNDFPPSFPETTGDVTYDLTNVTRPLAAPPPRLISRLDTLLAVLRTCKGRACTHPWEVLHPAGDVRSLQDALDTRYDDFYAEQERVYFTQCEKGYIEESEGPSGVKVFEEVGGMWDEVAG